MNFEWICIAIALVFLLTAIHVARDAKHPSRIRSAGFYLGIAVLLPAAPHLAEAVTGALVILVLALAASGVRMHSEPTVGSKQLKFGLKRLLLPLLLLPLLTLVLTLAMRVIPIGDLTPAQQPLAALVLGCVISFLSALLLLKPKPASAMTPGLRLLDSISWAPVLPMLLAVLGSVFQQAGVGKAVGAALALIIPTQLAWVCVLVYGMGMAILTMLLGNAFAAFPVLLGAVGVPLLVQTHQADVVAVASIGMLCGYCGTLLTPMAANFNLVPSALLSLDRYSVIRAQVMTALPLLACNLIWLAMLAW